MLSCDRRKLTALFCLPSPPEHTPRRALPSCRALLSTEAPLGGSWPEADLKKGSACRQTSSPGFRPSHIPLKSCTFSSSRDMISESFCFSRSERRRQRGSKVRERVGSTQSMALNGSSHLSSPWLSSPVVSCPLPSRWESLHLHPSPCPAKRRETRRRMRAGKCLKSRSLQDKPPCSCMALPAESEQPQQLGHYQKPKVLQSRRAEP